MNRDIILFFLKRKIKKRYWIIFLAVIFLFGTATIFNTTVTTTQGVNFKVTRLSLPLYLKIINFYDRHLNLKWLAGRITGEIHNKEDKIFKLFTWTHSTIHPKPKTLPVMDDHVWNVYVRRYGISDNFNDLFSTLCNYVGADSFFDRIYINNRNKKMNFSFVHLKRGWVVFEPYNGLYFKNNEGNWSTVEEIKKGDWKLEKISNSILSEKDVRPFLEKLPDIENSELKRASIQSPLNRLKYQLKKWFAGEKPLLE